MKVAYEKDDIFLQLNVYKLSKKNLELKLSEEEVIFNAITALVKRLEKHVSWLEDENGVLEKTKERLKRAYGAQRAMLGRSVGELVESGATCFGRSAMYISSLLQRVG